MVNEKPGLQRPLAYALVTLAVINCALAFGFIMKWLWS